MKKYITIAALILFSKGITAQTINYSYDSLGRLTQISYPDSININYAYDASGNRINRIVTKSLAGPLPVTLISFTGYSKPTINLLEWKTTSEINYSHFILQRSTDAIKWENVARIKSRSNSANSINEYSYPDSLISNKVTFYRLLLVDRDGAYKTSNVVIIRRDNTESVIKVFPNPVMKGEVFIDLGSFASSQKVIINLYDLSGKIVKTLNQNTQNNNLISLDLYGLKPSIYMLKIQKGNSFKTVKLVVLE